jgi:hypothetical protein
MEATPPRSGILILLITFVQATVGVAAGTFIHRAGRYLELIWVGMAIPTLGFGLFIRLKVDSLLAEIVTMAIATGLGVGLAPQPPLIALQSLAKSDDIATATALFKYIRSLSTSVLIVIGGVIFQNEMQAHYNQFQSFLPASIAQTFSGDMAAANINAIRALSQV